MLNEFTVVTMYEVVLNDEGEVASVLNEDDPNLMIALGGYIESDSILDMDDVKAVVDGAEAGKVYQMMCDYCSLEGKSYDDSSMEKEEEALTDLLENLEDYINQGILSIEETEEVIIEVTPNLDPVELD